MTYEPDAPQRYDWDRAQFRVDSVPECVVVTAAGEIDVQTAVGLGQAVQEALSTSSSVIIDLSRVTFVDSTGLGALIDARKRAAAEGGSVSLVEPPDIVRRILAGTHLQQVFPVFDSLHEALEALSRS